MGETELFQQFAKSIQTAYFTQMAKAHSMQNPEKAIEYLRREQYKASSLDFGEGFSFDEKEFIVEQMRQICQFSMKQIRNEAMSKPYGPDAKC